MTWNKMINSYNTSAVYISGLCFLRALCERCVPQRPTSHSVLFWFMKDIPWFEGRYAVTICGKVWSHEKYWKWWHKGKWLKPILSQRYHCVHLVKDDWKCIALRINRIMGITYLPNPDNLPIVMHLDNNKFNNHISNLKWGTHGDNSRQAFTDWLCPITNKHRESARKQWHANRRPILQFTKEWVFIKEYISNKQASMDTNIGRASIWLCANSKYKTAWWFIWEWKNQTALKQLK